MCCSCTRARPECAQTQLGVDIWGYGGFDGNGNRFKLGGNYQVAHNRISNSVAFGNVVKGFDQNNNAGGITILNCTGYANGTNFGLGNAVNDGEQHVLRNNISLGASDSISNADAQYNSWNSGYSVSNADFVSLDLSQATVARNPDGTLPETTLFRLISTSALVDAGVDVGLPYTGSAPDLGAFELVPQRRGRRAGRRRLPRAIDEVRDRQRGVPGRCGLAGGSVDSVGSAGGGSQGRTGSRGVQNVTSALWLGQGGEQMTRAGRTPKALLARHGLRAKPHFGQNFLADARLATRIARLATATPGGTVVEIGAGLGALTRPLLERAARVVAIERDRDLLPVLREEFRGELDAHRLVLLEADAKAVQMDEWLASGPEPRVVAGNLPYQITGPLLHKIVDLSQEVARALVLVQLEVADRLAAPTGHRTYGALSVFVQARYLPHREFVVRRGAFYPPPRVDSALVVLEPLQQPLATETESFRAIVKAAFGQRRKQLRNAWRGVLGADAARIARAAERAGIDLDRRGESLSVSDFARMAQEVIR